MYITRVPVDMQYIGFTIVWKARMIEIGFCEC